MMTNQEIKDKIHTEYERAEEELIAAHESEEFNLLEFLERIWELPNEVGYSAALKEEVNYAAQRHTNASALGRIQIAISDFFSFKGGYYNGLEFCARFENDFPFFTDTIKKNLISFESIVYLSDREIQFLLQKVDTLNLATALKAASEEIREKIFNNMSKRAASMLKEDMEHMGFIREDDVEEAKLKIVNAIRDINSLRTIQRNSKEVKLIY